MNPPLCILVTQQNGTQGWWRGPKMPLWSCSRHSGNRTKGVFRGKNGLFKVNIAEQNIKIQWISVFFVCLNLVLSSFSPLSSLFLLFFLLFSLFFLPFSLLFGSSPHRKSAKFSSFNLRRSLRNPAPSESAFRYRFTSRRVPRSYEAAAALHRPASHMHGFHSCGWTTGYDAWTEKSP